ncbi:leucyl aminopeptidase [Polaromonas naphthalenivorans]|uniref:Probable cytosol aminopeptidase n=1 Tax=Polaromonas naphthalenivorans (strain CJ2) TaxID=365044 RepID=AMPA_POLNA|nr:leucyl aminopeptidase [Polaromonas naphthalenivorans]A1VP99.1 RecName: Full=Probable cytosol aminopeptidase; AltName: Full=Leucine aminopeptidase; Short=LAP; AltName: Full=Leucyl aminopeptidase [Polaromonas naphthalenivorans CJ2]ABM37477.1 aminopeptidase A, Metallo peptidase, MEROPS family M17 [Polaromonas naphthalenivorans CJ2]
MDFELKTLTRTLICNEKADALIVLIPEGLTAGDDALSVLAALAIKSGDLEVKPGKLLNAYRVTGIAATRVLLVGAGDASPKSVRTAVNAAMGALKAGNNVQRAVLCLNALPTLQPEAVRAAIVACSETAYAYTTTKSKPAAAKLQQMVVAVDGLANAQAGFDKAVGLAKGIELAKEWANRPANHATPTLLAGAAKELGKLPRIKTEVLGPKEIEKLGMGAFLAVAQGTAEPLRFIVLRYEGAAKAEAPVVLIGKGITFDTGGISIKPAAEMDEMKFDMCGAASVLGTFRALAELQPGLNVVGLIPACENMPGDRAIKPGDVVTSMSGQTIEILNTDAEGRLVLCDALTYAARLKPRAVVDIATLTGACVVALGGVRSGLFSNNEALAESLARAGESSLDPCWRMPLDDDYAEGLKSNFADVANVAGRAGGAVTAAKFLQRFAADFAWAHLDIAGTAWKSGAAKGATGRPVALLLDFLLGQVQAVPAAQPVKASPKTRPARKSTPAAKTRA